VSFDISIEVYVAKKAHRRENIGLRLSYFTKFINWHRRAKISKRWPIGLKFKTGG